MKCPTSNSPIFSPPLFPSPIPSDLHKCQLPSSLKAHNIHKFTYPNTSLKESRKSQKKVDSDHSPFRKASKTMKLIPSIFKNKDTPKNHHSLRQKWPSCKQPKTLSFRVGDDMFKTVNSVYFDPLDIGISETQDSWFTNSSESASFSTESEENSGEESLEMIVRGVRSERLFFEPGGTSSMILEEEEEETAAVGEKSCENFPPLKESVALAMESDDPYLDFKKSMEEMVETNGLKDWESLEELLGWYLKMNGKTNHGFIVGAFVDLLIGLASSNSNKSCSDHDHNSSFLSAASSFSSKTSSPLSSVGRKDKKEIDDDDDAGDRIVEELY